MGVPTKTVAQLERVAGHPALDFANTVSWRGEDREIEYLRRYDDLVAWSRIAGLLAPRSAARLSRLGRAHPHRAALALARARSVREAIFHVGAALARGVAPSSRAVARVHAAHLAALRHARLAPIHRGTDVWAPTWAAADPQLAHPWWPVAAAFASLLEHPGTFPIGVCPDCSWLFLDASRNRSRRWCSSGDCGNRARGQRFRDKRRLAP